jgi:uncharacterized Ntn-hydrolase superfamily protein
LFIPLHSGEPIYRQIYAHVRSAILSLMAPFWAQTASRRGRLNSPFDTGSERTRTSRRHCMFARISWFTFVVVMVAQVAPAQQYEPGEESTFSVIGRDPATGQLGIAVQSKTIASGARTPGGMGGVAVMAHQAASDPMYTTVGIPLLQAGMTPEEALDMMLGSDKDRNTRQVSILDIQGRTATWTSPTLADWKGSKCGVDYCVQGNTLTGPEVTDAMARSFESSKGPLPERLLDALEAGHAVGGDRRGMESAALLILKPRAIQDFGDHELDLRVDESRNPFVELRRILNAVRSQEMLRGAQIKLRAKDLKGAMDAAIAAKDKSQTSDNAWMTIADIHLQMGQRTEALSALGRAVALNPANKQQLLHNADFEALYKDPEFIKLVGSN